MHFSFMETLSTNLTCNVSTKDGSFDLCCTNRSEYYSKLSSRYVTGKVKSSFTLYLHIEFFPCRIESHVIDRNQSESQFKTKHGS